MGGLRYRGAVTVSPVTDINSDEFKEKLLKLADFIGVPVTDFSGFMEFNMSVATKSREAHKRLKANPNDPVAGTYHHGVWAYRPSRGRKDDARYLAGEVARVFDLHGLSVGYGNDPIVDGEPSTPFCKAVKFGIEVFGLSGGWRMPAKWVCDERRKIEP